MQRRAGGPGEPEKPRGNEPAEGDLQGKAGFGDGAAEAGDEVGVGAVEERGEERGDGHADRQPGVAEARLGDAPCAKVRVDDGVGDEGERHDAVQEGHVGGQRPDDGLGEEHDPGPG